jgi:hypothetical protein
MLKKYIYLSLITCVLATAPDAYSQAKDTDCIKVIRCAEKGTNESCHAYLEIWTLKGKFISKPFPSSIRRCPGRLNESHAMARHNFIQLFPQYREKGPKEMALESLDHISGEETSPTCHLNEDLPPVAPSLHRCDESILKKELLSLESISREAGGGPNRNIYSADKLQQISHAELQRADWLP